MAAPLLCARRAMLAIQGGWQGCLKLLSRSGVVDTAVGAVTANTHSSSVDVVRSRWPCQREDSSPRARTRRKAKLSTRRTANLWTPERLCLWLLCCEQRAAASRAQTLGYDAWGIAFVQLYASKTKLPAITRPTPRNPTISTDKPVKPNRHTRIDGGPAERRGGSASPPNADAERVESRRIQASAGLGTASAVLTPYQVRHVRRVPARDRARAVLRRRAVEAVSETATTAATTVQ